MICWLEHLGKTDDGALARFYCCECGNTFKAIKAKANRWVSCGCARNQSNLVEPAIFSAPYRPELRREPFSPADFVFFGDPHDNWDTVDALMAANYKYVFLLGDLSDRWGPIYDLPERYKDSGSHLITITGNHDVHDDGRLRNVQADSRVVNVGGINILCLGSYSHCLESLLSKQRDIDLVISHFPPFEKFHTGEAHGRIAKAVGAKLYLHGHYHNSVYSCIPYPVNSHLDKGGYEIFESPLWTINAATFPCDLTGMRHDIEEKTVVDYRDWFFKKYILDKGNWPYPEISTGISYYKWAWEPSVGQVSTKPTSNPLCPKKRFIGAIRYDFMPYWNMIDEQYQITDFVANRAAMVEVAKLKRERLTSKSPNAAFGNAVYFSEEESIYINTLEPKVEHE